MKKIYLLCLAMMGLFAPQANAQSSEIDNTFRFQDANGNEVKDGTTLTLSKLENGQISTGLFVKNISGKQTAGYLSIDISNMPNGSFTTCSFGSCTPAWTTGGVYESAKNVVEADAPVEDIATEWVPSAYGDWTGTIQLVVLGVNKNKFGLPSPGDIIGYGPKVTLHFVYADPTGINGISSTQDKKVAAIYSASGAKLSDMQKGLNIVKYTDGTTAKVLR